MIYKEQRMYSTNNTGNKPKQLKDGKDSGKTNVSP